MLVSEVTRSTTIGALMACPHDDRAPLMAWMEEGRREERGQRSQHMVLLYKWSHLEANIEARLL